MLFECIKVFKIKIKSQEIFWKQCECKFALSFKYINILNEAPSFCYFETISIKQEIILFVSWFYLISFLEKRQQGRFAGFSIYISKSKLFETSLCYKDGPQLPSLNFTGKCLQQGRHVIFYTERLNEITYPVEYQTTNVFIELCEVIVLGEKSFLCYVKNALQQLYIFLNKYFPLCYA